MGNTAQVPTRNLEGLGYLFIVLFLYVCLWGSEVNLSCHSSGVVHLVIIKLGFCFWVVGCWPETVSKLAWSVGQGALGICLPPPQYWDYKPF